jgi:hypothetical protein
MIETKPWRMSQQVHGQRKNRVLVRDSKNSTRSFFMTIIVDAPPEWIFSGRESVHSRKGDGHLFLMFSHIESQGSVKAQLNEEKEVAKLVIAILPWDTLTFPDQLFKAKYIYGKMLTNPDFPAPWPANVTPLATLDTDIKAFDTKITAAESKAKGTATAMKTASKLVHKELLTIMAMLQIKLNDKPLNAEEICVNAGFDHKGMATRGQRKREAVPGNEPGSLIATDTGAGYRQWQGSYDGGETIVALDPTRGGEITKTGLTSGQFYSFRCRLVLTKDRYGDWTDWFGAEVP